MARDAGHGGPSAVERRRVALRALLAGGEASSSATPTAASQAFEPEAVTHALRSSADWRGLGCTTVAASQVHALAAAADASRSSADWRGRRRRRGKERRKARGGGGVASGTTAMGGDVWCNPGIPFAAEASSVDCVVEPHQSTVGPRRRAQAESSHRERPGAPAARKVTMREHMSSSPTHSPPHHGMPLIDPNSVPSGRN